MESNEKKSLFKIGFVDFIKEHDIKFNPRPFSNPKHIASNQTVNAKKDNQVDLHLEIIKKVDSIIAEAEKEEIPEFKEVPFLEDSELIASKPLKHETMQKNSLWLE